MYAPVLPGGVGGENLPHYGTSRFGPDGRDHLDALFTRSADHESVSTSALSGLGIWFYVGPETVLADD